MTKTTETVVTEESVTPQPEGDVTVVSVVAPPTESSSSNQTIIELMDRIQATEMALTNCRSDLESQIQNLWTRIHELENPPQPEAESVTLVEPEIKPPEEQKQPKAAKSMLGRALLGG